MKDLQATIVKLSTALRRYLVVIAIVVFGAMYGFLILTSSKHATSEPSDAQINAKLQATSRPKIDEAAAEKLNELQGQNIEIKAIFDNARNNPFLETDR